MRQHRYASTSRAQTVLIPIRELTRTLERRITDLHRRFVAPRLREMAMFLGASDMGTRSVPELALIQFFRKRIGKRL